MSDKAGSRAVLKSNERLFVKFYSRMTDMEKHFSPSKVDAYKEAVDDTANSAITLLANGESFFVSKDNGTENIVFMFDNETYPVRKEDLVEYAGGMEDLDDLLNSAEGRTEAPVMVREKEPDRTSGTTRDAEERRSEQRVPNNQNFMTFQFPSPQNNGGNFTFADAMYGFMKYFESRIQQPIEMNTPELERLSSETKSLQSDVKSLEDKNKALNAELSEKNEQLKAYASKHDENEDRVKALEDEKQQISDEKEEIEKALSDKEQELAFMKSELQTANDNVANVRIRIDSTEKNASELQTRLDESRSELKALGDERDMLKTTISQLRGNLDSVSNEKNSLNTKVNNLARDLKQKQTDCDKAIADRDAARKSLEDYRKISEEKIRSLSEKLSSAPDQNAFNDLKSKLSAEKDANGDLRKQLQQTRDELKTSREAVKGNADLDRIAADAKKSVDEWKSRFEAEQQKNASLQRQNGELTGQVNNLRGQINTLKNTPTPAADTDKDETGCFTEEKLGKDLPSMKDNGSFGVIRITDIDKLYSNGAHAVTKMYGYVYKKIVSVLPNAKVYRLLRDYFIIYDAVEPAAMGEKIGEIGDIISAQMITALYAAIPSNMRKSTDEVFRAVVASTDERADLADDEPDDDDSGDSDASRDEEEERIPVKATSYKPEGTEDADETEENEEESEDEDAEEEEEDEDYTEIDDEDDDDEENRD